MSDRYYYNVPGSKEWTTYVGMYSASNNPLYTMRALSEGQHDEYIVFAENSSEILISKSDPSFLGRWRPISDAERRTLLGLSTEDREAFVVANYVTDRKAGW